MNVMINLTQKPIVIAEPGPKGEKGDKGEAYAEIDGGSPSSVYTNLQLIDAGGI